MKKIIYLSILCLIFSCTEAPKSVNQEPTIDVATAMEDLNISIFLDLSDRISPEKHPNETMEYFERDLGYVNSIAQFFKAHLLSKKSILLNDRMQLFLDPPPANSSINKINQELRLEFDNQNADTTVINHIAALYDSLGRELYDLAMAEANFPGSDIWGFFKNHVNDYCISPKHRNILFIITDGYVYHEENKIDIKNRTSWLSQKLIKKLKPQNGDWEKRYEEGDYGFIVDNDNLENLEVMVLGLNRYGKTSTELDIVKRYWSDWLMAMNVGRFELKASDLPSNLNKVIHQFIGVK